MWFVCIMFLTVLLYLFLIAPRMIGKPDRTPFLNVHYAHRGLFDNASEAPENSLLAFQKAAEAGYGIELDVQLSRDGIPVVFHDASLRRVCGIEGNVWDYDLVQLQQMKLYQSDQTIPTLEDALKTIAGKVPVIIEYKLDRVQTEVCEKAERLLDSYAGPYCIECFHPMALGWYRKNRAGIIRGQLSMDYWEDDKKNKGKYHLLLMTYLLSNILTRPDFISYQHGDGANLSLKICRWMGAFSVAWTIKSNAEYKAAKKYFDLFIFDSCRL